MQTYSAIARIATDIDSRVVQTGNGETTVAKFRIAVPKRNRREEPNYFACVVWGKQAEAVVRHVAKGSRIGVQGYLNHNVWDSGETNADGSPKKHSSVEVVAERVEFLDPKKKPEAAAPAEVDAASAVWQAPSIEGEAGQHSLDFSNMGF